jgi:hypothetical protein
MAYLIGFNPHNKKAFPMAFIEFKNSVPYREVPEGYVGAINTLGLDIGITAGGVMGGPFCFRPRTFTPVRLPEHTWELGRYRPRRGRRRECVINGSDRTIALQPVSVEGRVGIDLMLGVSGLELQFVR